MSTLGLELHKQVAAVASISGIAIGDPEDKATWKVHFESATEEQKQAAADVITAFGETLDSIAEKEAIKAKLAEIDVKSIRAIREYIEKQKNAPSELQEIELVAVELRKKLK